jgi:hypothetical protein
MMNRLLAAITTIMLVLIGTANADPLPNVYLGHWCFQDETALPVTTEKEREECYVRDGYMEIRRDGYSMHEQKCKYVSIKHTGEKQPASTKSRKADWILVIRILARCKGDLEGTV